MARHRPCSLVAAIVCIWLGTALSKTPAHESDGHPQHAFGSIYPRLSEAGDAIALSYQGAIWRMPRAGGRMVRLTHDEGFDIEPAWSPDGQRIAFIRTGRFYGGTLQLIRADDGAPIPLPRQIGVQDKLHFDRTGRRVLGNFSDNNRNVVLAWFDLETGRLGEPIEPSRSRVRSALSHDGQRIALATSLDVSGEQGGNNGPDVDLWTVPADGGEPQRILRFPARIYDLCWAADDRSLYVVTDLGGAHNDLWQLPLENPLRGARKLTFGQADEDCPSVSRDARWLLATDNRYGATGLVLRDLARGESSWLEPAEIDFGRPAGTLRLSLLDASSGEPVTARVTLEQNGGKFHAPPGALYRLQASGMHFYAEGSTELALPTGQYRLRVDRGPEYATSFADLEVTSNETATITVELQRWTHQAELGWYSGESHIHANYGYGHWYNSPRTVLAQCAGEDLLVCNLMVANSDGDGVFDREYFRGQPDPLSTVDTILYWNEEFRSTIWGHMTLLNLKQLVEPIFTGFAHTTHPHDHPTNADIADLTHDQDGHVNYTHPAQNVRDPYLTAYSAKELPIDVALGKVDTIDVMGSNHLANMPLWYRLLNCGFRIPASAGTDCFLNRIPSRLPGSDRAYVRVDGPFSYARWIENLKAGRSFVTNGPMFEFSVDDAQLGETIQLDGPRELRVQGEVRAQVPLERAELVYNGEVVAAVDATGDRRSITVDVGVMIDRSGWLALRAIGSQQNRAFGHTSPIYVEVSGRPLDARADAEYFLEWIDRLWSDVRRRNRIPSRHQVHVESQVSAARDVYRRLTSGD